MKINRISLSSDHWTSDYIPISYNQILTPSQYNKSFTFYWTTNYNLHAICRAYYINKNRVEIGDVWLNPDLRGQKINGVKVSLIFMRRIISKIWSAFNDAKYISLVVDKENIPAMRLYDKLHFKIKKGIVNKELNINNGWLMIRKKSTAYTVALHSMTRTR